MDHPRQLIFELVSGYLDSDLDPVRLEALQALLVTNRAALHQFIDASLIDDLLYHLYTDRQNENRFLEILNELKSSNSSLSVNDLAIAHEEIFTSPMLRPSQIRSAHSSPSKSDNNSFRRVLQFSVTRRSTLTAACAALLLLGAAVFWRGFPSPVAMVTQLTNVEWSDEKSLIVGESLRKTDRLQLKSGLVEITFESGAIVLMNGPADLEVIDAMRARIRSGRITADVADGAQGFTFETPSANVVDLGTRFGVGVGADSTDVVVFDGIVDLEEIKLDSSHGRLTRLTIGDALRINSDGGVKRIVSVSSQHYPLPNTLDTLPGQIDKVISQVSDNIRSGQTTKCYRIVHGGMRNDARAYVDRVHEWNGITADGLPGFLVGADYVMPFNDDKRVDDLEVVVKIARQAKLYVFFDARGTPPDWLTHQFKDTGVDIGLDEGPSQSIERRHFSTEEGAGMSVDVRFRVWKKSVRKDEYVTLGPRGQNKDGRAMYGIAAVGRIPQIGKETHPSGLPLAVKNAAR